MSNICFNHLTIKKVTKAHDIIATKKGTHFFDWPTLLSLKITRYFIPNKNKAAIIQPNNGDMNQLETIFHIVHQSTTQNQRAAIHQPITHHTIEWVVETGALKNVARLSHNDAENNAESIIKIKILTSFINQTSIIPFFTVSTTSHQAITAQSNSNTAAIIIACFNFKAHEPTAGQTLLATSLAHIFTAIYTHKKTANNKKKLAWVDKSVHTNKCTQTKDKTT